MALTLGVVSLGLVAAAAVAATQADGLDAEGQAILAEQQQNEQAEADFIQQGKDAVAAGNVQPDPGPPSYSPDPWPQGIFGKDQADVGGGDFLNEWGGIIDGQYVAVYAGSQLEDLAAGLLLEQLIKDPRTMESTWLRFDTPIPGPVKIVDASGTQLTIESESPSAEGRTAVFDVATQAFN